jgi:cell division septation protein DedD
MGKKRFEMDARQLSFILLSMIVLVILAFILGMQIGSLIKNLEKDPAVSLPRDLPKKVLVSFRNTSGFSNVTTKTTSIKPAMPEKKVVRTERPAEVRKIKQAEQTIFYIQVGAFRHKESANALALKLKKMGMEYKITGSELMRVLVVVSGTEADKIAVLEKLKKEGIDGMAVKR